MKVLKLVTGHAGLHTGLIWLSFGLIFYADFLTPLGFAHGILYLPLLIYVMLVPGVGVRLRQLVFWAALAALVLVYALQPNLSNLPEIYIASNRALSAAVLILTYMYCRKIRVISLQNIELGKQEQSQRKTLDDFIDAMPVQIWQANADGVVDFVSSSLVAFTGKRKEVILDDWLALLHPEDRNTAVAIWNRSVQTGAPYHVDFRLQRHDGAYLWFQTQAIAQRDRDGRIQRWLGSSIDIDDLRLFRDESERLAAQYRHTVESITDAFLTLDHEFRFTYLNQKAAEILDSTVEELLGKVIWDFSSTERHDSAFAVQFRRAAQSQEKLHFEEYYEPTNKWLEVHVYPSTEGLTVYSADITERRELEQRLRESQKLEAVGHLTGGVAHDFNNLLTVILGNAEMLAELSTDPGLRSMAELTLSAARRGAELTSRLLAFSRRQPLDPKATDLNQLAEAIQSLVRRTLPENIELSFVPDPDLGIAEVDAGELDTALLNLVINARDAMPDGGKLTIETANKVLDSDYADRHPEVVPAEYVMICVSDTGAGMTPETVQRAFEPFFTTKTVGKGSGLGLSMVFGFTKQSGGHIKIYSEPGEGTTVKLYFPRVWDSHQVAYQQKQTLPPEGGREHILIAEDDDLVLAHLERQLNSLGYRVTAVTSGPEALNTLQACSDIDLLLTDIIMPGGMTGRELADLARAADPALKVLYTSGYTENAIVHHGRLDPGVELLGKPYTYRDLAIKVRRVLDKEMNLDD